MSNKLYVGNLPYDADESTLRAFFGNGQNGRLVTRVRMVSEPITGQRRGFAFVELNGAEQTRAALTLNGKWLNGRQVVVRLAHPSQSSRKGAVRRSVAAGVLQGNLPAPLASLDGHLPRSQSVG